MTSVHPLLPVAGKTALSTTGSLASVCRPGRWVKTFRVLVPFRYKGQVFERGDVVDEDELPIEKILSKRPDLVTLYGGRRRRTTDTWRVT